MENFRIAIYSIWERKFRSLFLLVNIGICVSIVISILTTADSVRESIINNYKNTFGLDAIRISLVDIPIEKVNEIKEKVKGINYILVNKIFYNAVLIYNNKDKHLEQPIQLWGSNISNLSAPNHWQLNKLNGRFFEENEIKYNSEVCIISSDIYNEINGNNKIPIKICVPIFNKGTECINVKPIGVVKNWNRIILIPISLFCKKFLEKCVIDDIEVGVGDIRNIEDIAEDIGIILGDGGIKFSKDTLNNILETVNTLYLVGSVFAILTLITAGFSIMNGMLISVTERVSEIGIRRAVGAKKRDLMLQFFVEALILSLMGGTIGLFVGIIEAIIAIKLILSITEIVYSIRMIISTFLFSIFICTIFGLIPAYRASKMDPVIALQST